MPSLLRMISIGAFLAINSVTTAEAQRTPSPAQIIARSGDWQLTRSRSGFDDRVSCQVTNSRNRWVSYDPEGLMIIYRGRGGIQGARYRVNDGPASEMILPTRAEQEVGFITFRGIHSVTILQGTRLRVQGLTLLQGLAEDDINLRGLRDLANRLTECQSGALRPPTSPPAGRPQRPQASAAPTLLWRPGDLVA